MVRLLMILFALVAPSSQTEPPAYVWDGACKDCHEEIYKAWARTKHANAWSRLSAAEKQRECGLCHITGPQVLEERGRVVNANIQCESCHGPGSAHVETAKAGTNSKGTIVRKPSADECERCHNAKSPHFKGFFYQAMLPLSHRVGG